MIGRLKGQSWVLNAWPSIVWHHWLPQRWHGEKHVWEKPKLSYLENLREEPINSGPGVHGKWAGTHIWSIPPHRSGRSPTLGQYPLGRREPNTEPQEAQLRSCSEESLTKQMKKEQHRANKATFFLTLILNAYIYLFSVSLRLGIHMPHSACKVWRETFGESILSFGPITRNTTHTIRFLCQPLYLLQNSANT